MAVVGRDCWGSLVHSTVPVGTPKSSCPRQLWSTSPKMETPPLPLATCASAQPPQQWRSVSWCSEGTACVSVCALCLWPCHWAPLRSPGCILFAHLLQVFALLGPSPSWTVPAFSATYITDAPVASSSLCGPLLASLQYIHVSLVLGSPRTGRVTSAEETGRNTFPLTCWYNMSFF